MGVLLGYMFLCILRVYTAVTHPPASSTITIRHNIHPDPCCTCMKHHNVHETPYTHATITCTVCASLGFVETEQHEPYGDIVLDLSTTAAAAM